MRLTREQRATAELVCTSEQLEALDLWNVGYGYMRIARVLHIDPKSARMRIERALKRLGLNLESFAA